ncbi:GNAT family N-acetyltransferase [Haliea sp. E17]|uniref:GNAT family N-acetyltransferase n=1 Tax=Haliea sp. E17 TaxID=3401576 RepID=UPI003AAAF4AE
MIVQLLDQFNHKIKEYAQEFGPDTTPDCDELAEFAAATSARPRITVLIEQEACKGMFSGVLERNRIAGLSLFVYGALGQGFYDYSRIHHAPDYRNRLLTELKKDAKRAGADCIYMQAALLDDSSDLLSGHLSHVPTRIFRAEKSENGFSELLKKKSVRRHVNKARRELGYTCEHFTATSIQASDIDSMGRMHIETRRFHNNDSDFKRPETLSRYMSSLENRVLTRISVGDEVLGYHYGLVFGTTMIWHTPVINIKYLDYSPLEILLFEVLSYCDAESFEVFDLGVGDEPYKARFSNDLRSAYDVLIPISLKGKLASTLKLAQQRFALRKHAEAGTRWLSKSIPSRQYVSSGTQIFMVPDTISNNSDSGDLMLIEAFSSLVEFYRSVGMPIDREDYSRIREGGRLCVFESSSGPNNLISYCWAFEANSISALAHNAQSEFQEQVLLSDFNSIDGVESCEIVSLCAKTTEHFSTQGKACRIKVTCTKLSNLLTGAGFSRETKKATL